MGDQQPLGTEASLTSEARGVDAQKAPSTPSADHDDAQGHDESDVHKGDHFGHFDVENLGVGWPVAFATQRPICALSSFCGGICGWVFLFVILLVSGANVMPFSTDVPLYLRDSVTYERSDSILEAMDTAKFSLDDPANQLPREIDTVTFEVIFELTDGDDIFTTDRLALMNRIEGLVLNTSGYTDFCMMANSSRVPGARGCVRRASVLNFLDPLFIQPENVSLSKYLDPLEVAHPDFSTSNVETLLGNWSRWNSTRMQQLYGISFAPIWQVVDASFGVPLDNRKSKALLVTFAMGTPLKALGFASDEDREQSQKDKIGKFLFDNYDPLLSDLREPGSSLKVWFLDNEQLMSGLKIEGMLISSMLLTMASLLFVFFYLSFMTSSFFIGTLGMFQIVMSSVPSIILYRYVFQQAYFGVFNVLSLFIILGIGADDMFVFIDHWNLSGTHHVPPEVRNSLYLRMSWTFRIAGKAMLITSFTTVCAFLANSFSAFPAVYTFGIFSALLVMVNYVCVITFFVAVMSVYHVHVESHSICLADKCAQMVGVTNKADDDNSNDLELQDASAKEVDDDSDEVEDHAGNDLGTVSLFFRDHFGPKMAHHRVGRFVSLAATLVLFIVFLSLAVQLEPDPETPSMFQKGSNYQDFSITKAKYFGGRLTNPRQFPVYLAFGIAGIDRSGTLPTDRESRGKVIWDTSFNFNTLDSQKFLHQLCLKASDTSGGNPRRLKTGAQLTVECFMIGFQRWYDDLVSPPASTRVNSSFTFPITAAHCPTENFTDAQCFDKYLTDFILDPTERADGLVPRTNYDRWREYVFAEATTTTPILRFMIIRILTDMTTTMKFEEGIDLYNVWESWFQSQLTSWDDNGVTKQAPVGLRTGFQYTVGAWHYFFLQEKLVQEAYSGIFISLALAFVILTVSTRNIIVSSTATLTITMIVLSVMGFVVAMGWKLGVLESINLILVPGLAVDYTVHLADAYLASHSATRAAKVNDVLSEVGVSILSGAFSTLGASLFMMFAPISFFLKFALFMFATIGFSCIYSLCFFSPLLAIVGPEGNAGMLFPNTDFEEEWGNLKAKVFGNGDKQQSKVMPS